jgi:hypothetical protein
MDGYVDWGDVATRKDSEGGGTKIEYLWLKSGNKYTFRPVHMAVHLWKYFHRDSSGRLRTAICGDPDTCPVAAAHPELGRPSERYAIYVIDREDGKLKVMEGPKTAFFPFRQRWEATKKNPGSSTEGGDWQITVSGKNKNTTYSSIYLEDAALTKEEVVMIKEAMAEKKNKLTTIYKENTPEEIEKRLFGEWETNDSNSDSSGDFSGGGYSSAPASDVNTNSNASDNDLDMDW